MRMYKTTVILLLFVLISCAQNVSTKPAVDEINKTFQALLEEAISTSFNSVPGVAMSVIFSHSDKSWSGTSGFDSDKKDNELTVDQPFRIASITKTFVAAAILRLHELDSLSIDDSISKYISETHRQILKAGGYNPDLIKLKHCLNHTSGLFDYAMGSSTFAEISKNDPLKRWTRTEQLEGAMTWGKKVGEPGERYFYSDTGYILLGETIESFFNRSLAAGLRSLLKFKALGLKHTWLESLESHPQEKVAVVYRYFRGDDVTAWDPSIDLYGGGGLVSTTPDLVTFMHALFNHKVFDQPETLELMLTKPTYAPSYITSEDRRYKDYRYGLWEKELYGEKAYMHNGLWGIQLLHVPGLNSTIAINYTKGGGERLMKKAILVAKNLSNNQ